MVPVLSKNKKPLMPCSEKRARKLLEQGKAKPYWCKSIFCIILQKDSSNDYKQEICIGIDPGSKFNGYSVKSQSHTLLNLQIKAVDTIKKKVEERSMLRKNRRQRKTPYRKNRFNRSVKNRIPPSTKGRWQQHFNIVKWMNKIYPIMYISVEDIKATTIQNAKKWNKNFSPLEIGKSWFYTELKKYYEIYTYQGYDTYEMRKNYGFKKNSSKSKKDFYTHCVDAWCLANEVVGGHTDVENTRTIYLKPIVLYKRKLHEILPKNNNFRRKYGGTISQGIKRGTLVKHQKYNLCYVGGTSNSRLSLHCVNTGKRLCRNAKKEDLKILTIIKYQQELI